MSKDPLEEIAKKGLEHFKKSSEKIPMPDFLNMDKPSRTPAKKLKYDKEFDIYCRWAAKPKSERMPKTNVAFAKKHKIPIGSIQEFKSRDDYRPKWMKYQFEWFLDNWPDVAKSIYERAMKKGGTADARIYAEMVAKHLEKERPDQQITNFALIGVKQSEINKLFMPDDVKDAEILKEDEPKKNKVLKESVQGTETKLPTTKTNIPIPEQK